MELTATQNQIKAVSASGNSITGSGGAEEPAIVDGVLTEAAVRELDALVKLRYVSAKKHEVGLWFH
jgi:hypothetical protein